MDSVGNFIVQLKNASAVKKESVSVSFSSFKLAIAEKLQSAGYVMGIEKRGKKARKTLEVMLKYDGAGRSAIEDVKRISKPGRRIYKSVLDIHRVRYGHGALLLSTPKGVMTDKEARKEKVGGEALFEIW